MTIGDDGVPIVSNYIIINIFTEVHVFNFFIQFSDILFDDIFYTRSYNGRYFCNMTFCRRYYGYPFFQGFLKIVIRQKIIDESTDRMIRRAKSIFPLKSSWVLIMLLRCGNIQQHNGFFHLQSIDMMPLHALIQHT